MAILTDNVRKYSHKILSDNNFLTINTDSLADLGQEIWKLEKMGISESFTQNNLDTIDKLGLTLFFNVVNFCFMDPVTKKEYKYKSRDGGEIMRSTGLFRAMQESNIRWSNFEDVANLTSKEWQYFTQLSQRNILYLGIGRHTRIVKFARYLLDKGYKNPIQLIESQRFEVNNLLQILVESQLFEDEFLKRAQVVIRGINDSLSGEKIEMKGMKDLTCMADYRLPQVFYNLNVIKISSKVINSLLKFKNVLPNSDIEISLRASVIVIGEILSERMNIPEFKIDVLLWRLSQDLSRQGVLKIPHMIVATDKY